MMLSVFLLCCPSSVGVQLRQCHEGGRRAATITLQPGNLREGLPTLQGHTAQHRRVQCRWARRDAVVATISDQPVPSHASGTQSAFELVNSDCF